MAKWKKTQPAQSGSEAPEVSQATEESKGEEIVAPEPSAAQGDISGAREESAPTLSDAERGNPGKHIEQIVKRFGRIPDEVVFKLTREVAILTDGTKITHERFDALRGVSD